MREALPSPPNDRSKRLQRLVEVGAPDEQLAGPNRTQMGCRPEPVPANTGSASTCVRPTAESIVDLMWATAPAARMTSGSRVLETETTSDHLYIEMTVSVVPPETLARQRGGRQRRWALG